MLRRIIQRFKLAFRIGLTMSNLTERFAKTHGHRTALISPEPLGWMSHRGEWLSYEELASLTARISYMLSTDLNVMPGDRVAVYASNDIGTLAVMFAIMRAGGVVVPLNPLLSVKEVRFAIKDAGCQVLITDPQTYQRTIRKKSRLPKIRHWAMSGPADNVPKGFVSIDRQAWDAPDDIPGHPISDDSVVAIFYTSGTTGIPKGAALKSSGILSNIQPMTLYAQRFSRRTDELALSALPLSHIMGFVVSTGAMAAGIPAMHFPRFDAKTILTTIEERNASVFLGVPAMYRLMHDSGIDSHDLSTIRVWISASDSMPADLMQSFKEAGSFAEPLGRSIGEAAFIDFYGAVELAGGAICRISVPGISAGQGFLGIPMFPYKARVVDDNGRELPPGMVGELVIQGPGVLKEYIGDKKRTETTIRDGWVCTGDLASKNRLGLVRFAGRSKDMIKCGGYSVFPAEIEEVLEQHPAISTAAVFGVPHATKGAAPVAAVTLSPGSFTDSDEIYEWAAERVAAFKRPRAVVILQPHELPQGENRKVQKEQLRERFKNILLEVGADSELELTPA